MNTEDPGAGSRADVAVVPPLYSKQSWGREGKAWGDAGNRKGRETSAPGDIQVFVSSTPFMHRI